MPYKIASTVPASQWTDSCDIVEILLSCFCLPRHYRRSVCDIHSLLLGYAQDIFCVCSLKEAQFNLSFTVRSQILQRIHERPYQVTKIRIAEENGFFYQVVRNQNRNCIVFANSCCCFGVFEICIFQKNWINIEIRQIIE